MSRRRRDRDPRRAPGRRGPPLLVAVLFLFAAPGPALTVELHGFAKSLNLHLDPPPRTTLGGTQVSSNRLRVDFATRVRELDLAFSVEDLLLYTNPPGRVPLPDDSVNRIADLERDWHRGERWANQLFVDRLNLRGTIFGADWTLGRQAIGFGRISLFSPLDAVAPFPPDALDTDVRPGVDAVRVVRYFGLGGQAGVTVVLGDEAKNHSYLGTFSYAAGGVDFLGIAGVLRDRPMAGAGLAGSLAGLGVKGEAALYGGKDPKDRDGDLHDAFAIAGLELWYRFENDLVVLTEYLYNGAGAKDPEGYLQALSSASFREGLSFLVGRHYLLIGPSYELHPLVTLNGLLIWNLEDGSALLRPLVDASLSDNTELEAFWSWNVGPRPRSEPFFPLAVPRSEFGSTADGGGLFLRYYF